MRLRLERCTAWVKRWSEAMDFFQTIFKTNIFFIMDFRDLYYIGLEPDFHASEDPIVTESKGMQKNSRI